MKSSDQLSTLLQEWRAETEASSDFDRGVWRRIKIAESQRLTLKGSLGGGISLDLLFSWVRVFAMPRVALAAAAVALFGGVFLGTLQARSSGEEQYLRSLNPYARHLHDR